MTKKIIKYMFIFLSMVVLVTVVAAEGCSSSSSTQTSTPSAQQPVKPSGEQPGPVGDNGTIPDFMKKILASVATKLNVSETTLTQAYEAAREVSVPPSPPGGDAATSGQDPESQASEGKISDFMVPIFEQMSKTLNIPASQISAAWQEAMKENQPTKK